MPLLNSPVRDKPLRPKARNATLSCGGVLKRLGVDHQPDVTDGQQRASDDINDCRS